MPKTKRFTVTVGHPEGEDFQQELVVRHNGEVLFRERDGGEPEDQMFYRDWAWVQGAILKAYELGLEDGREENA